MMIAQFSNSLKNNRRRYHLPFWCCTALLLLGISSLSAQNRPSFTAYTDAEEVLQASYVEVTFTLRNGEGRNFKAPDFVDFSVLAGPSRGVSTTIVNGQVSSEMSFSYTLQPRRTGVLRVGSATIVVNGRTLRTNPLTVKVVQGKTSGKASGGAEPYFVEAAVKPAEAYVGQQLRLDYKLFTTVEIQNFNIVEESDYLGFYAEDLQQPDPRVRRELVKGREYYTRILKSMALYPQRAGQISIEPASMQLGMVVDDPNSSGSLFFGGELRRVAVVTDPLTVKVKPLPAGAPPSFSGAVGTFNLSSSLSRSSVTTDDVVSLQLTITGDGDLKRIQAPLLMVSDSFEVYEPKVKEEVFGEEAGLRVGRKVFEYLLLPKHPGAYAIRPEFTYFDPAQGRYITLTDNSFAVDVRQGSQKAVSEGTNLTDATGEEIRPLKTNARLRRAHRPLLANPLFWILSLLPLGVIAGMLIYQRQQSVQAGADPALRRNKYARKVALQRLQQANMFLQSSQSRAFYDEVSKAFIGYISDKLRIPLAEQTKDAIRQRLLDQKAPEDLIRRFMDVLQNCEIALFAGRDNAPAMKQTYEEALEVISALEENLTHKGKG